MGNKPPKPPQKPPPEEGNGGGGCQKPPGEGGGQNPPPPSGGGQNPPPPSGGGQNPPPPSGGGQNPPPPSGGGQNPPAPSGGDQNPPPSTGGGCEPCGSGSDSSQSGPPQPAGPSHPLNQLDEDEIRETVRIIKEHAPSFGVKQDLIFASVSMKEPPKAELLPFLYGEGAKPPRKSWTVLSPCGMNEAYEVIVNLDARQIEDFTKLPPGTQPSFNTDDPITIQDVIRRDDRVKKRAEKAGITNMDFLICDAWSYGYNDTEEDKKNLRLMDMYLYKRNYEGDNQYAHPLDFLVTVNVVTREIIDIVDLPVCPKSEPTAAERPIPPPEESHNYDPRVLPQDYYRNDVKPLEITQCQGPSFKINGNTITWQRWEMIIGFNFREGLTLHNITFDDHVEKRSILYRAALSEMVVPYGDPRVPYYRKSAFDLGEYGLGYNANPLTNGCDCLGEIRYMDFVFADSMGKPMVTRNAICIHEEDAGVLQKHTEFRNGNVTISRARKLVISFIATVTNYDYLFYWNFFQDGTIEVDIKATGLLSVHSLGLGPDCGQQNNYGTTVANRINAPYHQHIFCARLDTMIDGPNNTVAMQEVVPLECGAENPFHQGFNTKCTILETTVQAATDTCPETVRSWLVANENKLHPYTKKPVAWKLLAPGFTGILASPDSGVYRRGGFAHHNVWVTPYNDEQLYAAGKYINQAPGDTDGVHVWAEKCEDIRNKDIVLWHTFGLTHIPRCEDYPLMAVEGASFMFRPCNFFTANPALDVPAPKKKNCKIQK